MLAKSVREISSEMYFNWLHDSVDRIKIVEGRNGVEKRWILTNKNGEIIPDVKVSFFFYPPIYWLFELLKFPTTLK